MTPDKKRAKRIFLEIIRESGGNFGKTKLFKAFWLSHLYFNAKSITVLSDWPIVRMPNGPGVHRGDVLLGELEQEGAIKINRVPKGPFTEMVCELADPLSDNEVGELEVASIKEAVDFINDSSATEISRLSHDYSRAWNENENGAELNIYTDTTPDEEYVKVKTEMEGLLNTIERIYISKNHARIR